MKVYFARAFPEVGRPEQPQYDTGSFGGVSRMLTGQTALAGAGLTRAKQISFLWDISGTVAHSHLVCISEVCV